MISQELKDVYNEHLYATRTFNRQPFKAKKNFDKFKEHKDYRHYFSLSKFFKKHTDINQRLFFEATLYFHKDEKFISIKEYVKTTALKNYIQYCKLIDGLDLTNPKSIEFLKDSYKFIYNFCKEKDIQVKDYLSYQKEGQQPNFLIHLKGHKVCRYSLFSFPEYFNKLKLLYREPELWDMYMGSGDFNPNFYLKRYDASVKFKQLSKKFRNKLSNI